VGFRRAPAGSFEPKLQIAPVSLIRAIIEWIEATPDGKTVLR
jgi:hypothetical protein